MLKLTTKQLQQSLPAFMQMANMPLAPGNQRLAYNLGKTLSALKKEGEALGKQELEIFKTFGATEENGQWKVDFAHDTGELKEHFNEEIEALNAIEIEVWGHHITLSELEKANINLSPAQFELLDWLIVEDAPLDAAE